MNKKTGKSFLFVSSNADSLVNFRGDLISKILDMGHDVHVATPRILPNSSVGMWVRNRKIVCHSLPLSRNGLNPLQDLLVFFHLVKILLIVGPHWILCYTIKPVIWGTLAAALLRVPHKVALVTGLGYAFTGSAKGKRLIVQRIVRILYSVSLKKSNLVIFQNSDDRNYFLELGIIDACKKTLIVNGSGVNLDSFSFVATGSQPLSFLMVARLLGDKGVREYVRSAQGLKKLWPDSTWHLVGGLDSNPDSIDMTEIDDWVRDGSIKWHGAVSDVRPYIAESSVFVLPSYREGTPRSVLEAMSMGRAIITTDAPGCRETVVPGHNGFLVLPRDTVSLSKAMLEFLENPDLVPKMGYNSRKLAEEKYDVRKVNHAMLSEMKVYVDNR